MSVPAAGIEDALGQQTPNQQTTNQQTANRQPANRQPANRQTPRRKTPAGIPAALAPAVFNRVRAVLFVLALLPLARLFYLGFTDGLSANPIEFVIRSLGTWALVLLIVTLSVTPLRQATGWAWLARLRRMLGLFTFFYALLHFSAYFWLDQSFDFAAIWKDIVKRPYITVGFLAFVLLIPLAVTSTNAMVKRLGGRNWQRLHRLVYVIAAAGALHYWWQKASKNDIAEPT
ncbi:MAG TPA: protein-methionine-sulfoxide reductase heme-binding subunit MsrQ, partial [Burkholderiaceae bacterium]|nr:protein-methionine-sulfoxide reductase heme-binding subunit MsrQ [Burkholderiaceae bacterium]